MADDALIAVRIKDGVFVGNITAAQDEDFLFMNKVTKIVNCAGSEVRDQFHDLGIQYLTFPWRDSAAIAVNSGAPALAAGVMFDPGNRNVEQTVAFVNEALDKGECVLIHDVNGASRACAWTAAYLMAKYGWKLDNALSFLQMAHQDMEIRPHWMRQLRQYARKHSVETDVFDTTVDDSRFALDNDQWMLRNTLLNGLTASVQEGNALYQEAGKEIVIQEPLFKNSTRRRRLIFSDTNQGTSFNTFASTPVQQIKPAGMGGGPTEFSGSQGVVALEQHRASGRDAPLDSIVSRPGTPNSRRLESPSDVNAKGRQQLPMRTSPAAAAATQPAAQSPSSTPQQTPAAAPPPTSPAAADAAAAASKTGTGSTYTVGGTGAAGKAPVGQPKEQPPSSTTSPTAAAPSSSPTSGNVSRVNSNNAKQGEAAAATGGAAGSSSSNSSGRSGSAVTGVARSQAAPANNNGVGSGQVSGTSSFSSLSSIHSPNFNNGSNGNNSIAGASSSSSSSSNNTGRGTNSPTHTQSPVARGGEKPKSPTASGAKSVVRSPFALSGGAVPRRGSPLPMQPRNTAGGGASSPAANRAASAGTSPVQQRTGSAGRRPGSPASRESTGTNYSRNNSPTSANSNAARTRSPVSESSSSSGAARRTNSATGAGVRRASSASGGGGGGTGAAPGSRPNSNSRGGGSRPPSPLSRQSNTTSAASAAASRGGIQRNNSPNRLAAAGAGAGAIHRGPAAVAGVSGGYQSTIARRNSPTPQQTTRR